MLVHIIRSITHVQSKQSIIIIKEPSMSLHGLVSLWMKIKQMYLYRTHYTNFVFTDRSLMNIPPLTILTLMTLSNNMDDLIQWLPFPIILIILSQIFYPLPLHEDPILILRWSASPLIATLRLMSVEERLTLHWKLYSFMALLKLLFDHILE